MSGESPEQLLDAFRAAALSVTKLYKTSAAAQAKSRADGYQDCIEDLLAYLERECIGFSDGEGMKVKKWAVEKLEGRDTVSQGLDSEDEIERAETESPPDISKSTVVVNDSAVLLTEPSTQVATPPMSQSDYQVPTQETFTFRAPHPYPSDVYLNIANLDLSEAHDSAARTSTSTPSSRRWNTHGTGSRSVLGRGAGHKRKVNIAEIFDFGGLGSNGKDTLVGGKRSRHN